MVSAVYDFRCNSEYFDGYDDLHSFLETKCKKWVFQLEKGDKTGYLHYQGRLSLIKKTTSSNALKILENKFNFLEPTVSKEHRQSAFYCMKEQTRQKEPETDADYKNRKAIFVPDIFKKLDTELRPFQKTIRDYPLNPRKVNLLIDTKGNLGKSYLSSVMEIQKKGFRCPPMNDFKDVMQLLCNYCMDNEIRDIGHLFFDLPRAMYKGKLAGIFSSIEEILQCRLFDLRNHFKIWYINCPNIWVYTNCVPDDLEDLSLDRWQLWEVIDNELVAYNTLPKKPVKVINLLKKL